MQTLAKASLISLTIFSAGCATTQSSFVPVGCLGIPVNTIQFTAVEAEFIPMSAVDKIVKMRETYKARINAQCEINAEHDRLNSGK